MTTRIQTQTTPQDNLEAWLARLSPEQAGKIGQRLSALKVRTVATPRPAASRPAGMPTVLSLGGGADSFAMLLWAIQRGAQPDICVFIDVSDGTATSDGEDPGEWPGTYRHIREVVMPLCEHEGIEFVWIDHLSYPVRDARSLFSWMDERGQIPVAGDTRICTKIAKVERFEKWLANRFPDMDVEVWIGFEAGEERRVKTDPNAGLRRKRRPGETRRHNHFPLIERGWCRCRAVAFIERCGYPVPRKSACMFCPYASLTDWQTLQRDVPVAFGKTVELEARKRQRPTARGYVLSIMGFRTFKNKVTGEVTGYRAPPLPVYVQGKPTGRTKPCGVCGAAQRATKATGCGYLTEAPPKAA